MKNRIYLILFCLVGVACSTNSNTNDQTSTVRNLSFPSNEESSVPFLFTDKNDMAYLSWVEKKGEEATFKFSRLQENQWSEPISIASGNTWFVNWADYPMIATDGGNNFISHVLKKSGESTYAYDIEMFSSRDAGKNWQKHFKLNQDGKQAEHGFVTMIPYKDNIFITWLDGRNTVGEGVDIMEGMDHGDHAGAMSLRAAIIDYDCEKIDEWELDNKTCDCCQTSAAITDNGPIVVYRDRSDEEIRDMSIVRLVNGAWTEPNTIYSDNWKIAGCPVNGPRVSAIGNTLAIAWFGMVNDTAQVKVIFSPDGGETFLKPIRIDEGNAIGRVDVVMLDDDNAVVSWMEGSEIKAVRASIDGSKQSSFTIASSSQSRSSGFPQMTKSGNELIFAWTDDTKKKVQVASITL